MLEAFDIKYLSRTAVKVQVLVNLVAEIIEGVGGSRVEEDGILGV